MMKLRFSKNFTFLITASEATSKVATFFVIPVSGLLLATSDFNVWSIVFPSIQILSSALAFGLPSYVLRSYYSGSLQNKPDLTPIYNSFLILLSVTFFIFLGLKVMDTNSPVVRWDVYWILISNSFLLLIQQKYQADKNGVKYFNQSIVWRLVFALGIVIFYVFRMNIDLNFLLAFLLGTQILLVVVAIYQECLPFKISIKLFEQKEIFKFGVPLFLIGILQYIIYMNSRYFVYNNGMEADTAAFALIHTFVGGLNLLFVIFVRIYVPKLYAVLSGEIPQSILFIYKAIIFSFFEIITSLIFISLFCYAYFYEGEFEGKIFLITPIMIIGQFFYALQVFFSDSLVFDGKTFKLFIINLFLTFFSIGLSLFFVKQYGILGAAVGVAITQFLSVAMLTAATRGKFRDILGYEFAGKRLIRILVLLLSAFGCYYVFGKIPVIIFFLLSVIYLTWKLNVPLILKQFKS